MHVAPRIHVPRVLRQSVAASATQRIVPETFATPAVFSRGMEAPPIFKASVLRRSVAASATQRIVPRTFATPSVFRGAMEVSSIFRVEVSSILNIEPVATSSDSDHQHPPGVPVYSSRIRPRAGRGSASVEAATVRARLIT